MSALLFYGVYDDVIEQILKAQMKNKGLVCYLQPYSSDPIKLLCSGVDNSIKLFLTTTTNLNKVVYECEIVGWEDKQDIDQKRLDELNTHIATHQPIEGEVYREVKSKPCRNLIHVANMRKLKTAMDIKHLIKVSDGTPCKHRSQGGGYAVVGEEPFFYECAEASDLVKIANMDISQTEKLSLISSRVGQGRFRQNVISTWRQGETCALTGITVKELLIASHIKPWSQCVTGEERLDGANGILLCAHLDKLFDNHLITLKKSRGEYALVVSGKLDHATIKLLGVQVGTTLMAGYVDLSALERFDDYMAHHNQVFDSKESPT